MVAAAVAAKVKPSGSLSVVVDVYCSDDGVNYSSNAMTKRRF